MEAEKLMDELPKDDMAEHFYTEQVRVERPVRVVAGWASGITDHVTDAKGNRLLTVIRYPAYMGRPDVYMLGENDGKKAWRPLDEIWEQLQKIVIPRVAFQDPTRE